MLAPPPGTRETHPQLGQCLEVHDGHKPFRPARCRPKPRMQPACAAISGLPLSQEAGTAARAPKRTPNFEPVANSATSSTSRAANTGPPLSQPAFRAARAATQTAHYGSLASSANNSPAHAANSSAPQSQVGRALHAVWRIIQSETKASSARSSMACVANPWPPHSLQASSSRAPHAAMRTWQSEYLAGSAISSTA